MRGVALARPHCRLVDGGVQLAVEGEIHADGTWNLQLRLIDVRVSGVAEAEPVVAESPDERRLVHDVDVAMLTVHALDAVVDAACTTAADHYPRLGAHDGLIELGEEHAHVKDAVALVPHRLEQRLGREVLAVLALHLALNSWGLYVTEGANLLRADEP